MTKLREHVITTNENVVDTYEYIYAPWVKAMGLTELSVSEGAASGILPQNPALQWANGAICGQAIMAAIDTIVSLAMFTTERAPKAIANQNTHFLRPASGDNLRIEANVLKFWSVIAYAEAHVTLVSSGKLVAHSTTEAVF